MTRWLRRGLVAIALALAPALPAMAAPERVVSLNLCTDQMLVLLAPEKIAALSRLARDPALSYVADRAAAYPAVRPYAETVLALKPDLVLAGSFGAQATLALLERQGIQVLRVGLPRDFAQIRAEIRTLAAALGVPERGEALIADMDARLASVRPPSGRRLRALAWEPRGYTPGPGSLSHAVLEAAGLDDMATGRHVGLEQLLLHPPDLLVTPPPARFPSLATDLLHHPATRGIPRREIPPDLTICAGPFTAEAVQRLAR